MQAGEPFKQIVDGVDLATTALRVRSRYEPLFHINWHDLAPGNATFEYLAANIISPLFGIFDDYAYPISQATLDIFPLDVIPISPHSHQQVFPGIYKVYASMFRNLAQPFIDRLLLPNPTPKSNLYNSEMLNHAERLNLQMFTGSPTTYPLLFWRATGTSDRISNLGFPSLDSDFADFERQHVDFQSWPRNRKGHHVFIQRPAVVYHFNENVWRAQASILSSLLTRETDINTETGVMHELHRILTSQLLVQFRERLSEVQKIEFRRRQALHTKNRDPPEQLAQYVESERLARLVWEESDTPFAKQ